MTQLIQRLLAFLLAITIVLWGGYHAVRYTRDNLQLETVFKSTVPRSISGRGVAIREEQTLPVLGTGSPQFIYKDGTRIGIGQPVVEYFSGNPEDRSIKEIRQLEEEIAMLSQAQNRNINNFSSAPTISRDIREQLAQLTQISTSGQCEDLLELRKDLELLVHRREIATGKTEDFEGRISALKAELTQLKKDSNLLNVKQGVTPVSGFFAKNTDGYESQLTPETMKNLSIGDYEKLVSQEIVPTSQSSNGRLITHSKWYFSVCVPAYQTELLSIGQTASIHINGSNLQIPARVSQILLENHNDTAVVILFSDVITEDIINLRTADVTLSFSQFTGLRINSATIRFKENSDGTKERGVYVLRNHVVEFKKVDPIYEEQNFVLSRLNYAGSTNPMDQGLVRLYDQVIVSGGSDLDEGKIIQ